MESDTTPPAGKSTDVSAPAAEPAIDDGGPADRMSVRLFIATAAMQAFVEARAANFGKGREFPHANCAEHSLKMADALLAAARQGNGGGR